MRTIEEIIKDAESQGFWLINLFKLRSYPPAPEPVKDTGLWQANFCSPIGYYEFGTGVTPSAALEAALIKTAAKSPKPHLRTPAEVKELRVGNLEDSAVNAQLNQMFPAGATAPAEVDPFS